jgi:ATP-dependent helicase/nuclease subunit B
MRLAPAAPPRFSGAPDVQRLEAALATDAGEPGPLSGEVRIIECESPLDELHAVARDIRTRIAESGGRLRFRDFAVITRDLEPLAEAAAEVFEEFTIPYFLDRRRPLRDHPLHRLVEALFEAVLSDYSAAAVTRMLRTGLLWIARADAETLDAFLTAHCVRGAGLWEAPEWPFEIGRNRDEPPFTERLDAARRQIAAGLRTLRACCGAPPVSARDWARALFAALEALGVRTALEGWRSVARTAGRWESVELHRLAWAGLCEVLEELHTVLGDTPLTAADAARIVGGALGDRTLGLAPPTLDQVLVSSIERSRHPDIRHAWLIGFNEGAFPRPPAEDRLLSREDRADLAAAGLTALAPQRDEAFGERLLAYIACTRPSASLTLSYARTDAAGEPRLPSPLLADVQRALPGIPTEQLPAAPPPLTLPEAAREYLRILPAVDARRARYEQLKAALLRDDRLRPRLERFLAGLIYDNRPAPLALPAAPAAGQVIWRGAPSELDSFLQCPFRHFAERRLRLREDACPAPLPMALGNTAHEILAAVTQRAIDDGRAMDAIPDDTWRDWLADAWKTWDAAQAANGGTLRSDLAAATNRLRLFVSELVLVHAERWRRSGFRPVLAEVWFGQTRARSNEAAAPALPALQLLTAEGQIIELTGKIDRVDEAVDADGQRWRIVYDYKTSATKLRSDVLTGGALQAFAYLAAQTAHTDGGAARPAGAFIAPLYPSFNVNLPQYAAAWSPADQRLYFYRPLGAIDDRAAALLDRRTAQGFSPVANIRRNRDMGFAKNCDARPPAEIAARLDLARRTIVQAASEIATGVIDIAPLVQDDQLACRRCTLRPLCRFERPLNRPRAAQAPNLPELAGCERGGEQS